MDRRRFAAWILLAIAGCGDAPAASDPDAARAALEAALEAWKEGGTPASLLERSPAVHVADYRWEAGYALQGYAIAESAADSGFDRRYPVELRLKTPRGRPSREKAVYNVSTSPSLTVVRDPES